MSDVAFDCRNWWHKAGKASQQLVSQAMGRKDTHPGLGLGVYDQKAKRRIRDSGSDPAQYHKLLHILGQPGLLSGEVDDCAKIVVMKNWVADSGVPGRNRTPKRICHGPSVVGDLKHSLTHRQDTLLQDSRNHSYKGIL